MCSLQPSSPVENSSENILYFSYQQYLCIIFLKVNLCDFRRHFLIREISTNHVAIIIKQYNFLMVCVTFSKVFVKNKKNLFKSRRAIYLETKFRKLNFYLLNELRRR